MSQGFRVDELPMPCRMARMGNDDISSIAESLGVPVGRQTAWTRALDRAVAAREPAGR
mgnify:CR=1 FL=1